MDDPTSAHTPPTLAEWAGNDRGLDAFLWLLNVLSGTVHTEESEAA